MSPLADGGDGTLDVLIRTWKGRLITTRVRGPLGKPVLAKWGLVGWKGEKTAVIEMARASGLALLRGPNRILEATSFGTGQLIKAALDQECRRLLIGVGGTATSDGGSGALRALGLRYFDRDGRELSEKPVDLIRLHRLDWSGFDPRLKKTKIHVLCDVRNPLLGATGSARTFGPQKGATPSQVFFLEKFLKRWAAFAPHPSHKKPGAGAAGALAFGLAGFSGAELVEGAPFLMKAVGWEKVAREADLIITGEGKLDRTSLGGKVIGAIGRKRGNAPVFALCGSVDLPAPELRRLGIARVVEMGARGLKNPERSLVLATRRLFETEPEKMVSSGLL